MQEQLTIIINTPDQVVWEGRAESLSSENSAGPFDVLPGHANFITKIENQPIIIRVGGSDKKYQYENAVVAVRENTVTVYADI